MSVLLGWIFTPKFGFSGFWTGVYNLIHGLLFHVHTHGKNVVWIQIKY